MPIAAKKKFACPVEAVISVIGGKYKPVILYHLLGGALRFSELSRIMPEATAKMLTQQLRELEAAGIVKREVFAEVPPRTQYSLTPYGETLKPMLEAMCSWGRTYLSELIEEPRVPLDAE